MLSTIPTLLTLSNAFLGFISVYFSYAHNWGAAGVSIFFATICDLFDGRLARILGVDNNFGKEMDSFADFLSFGIAPAIMIITACEDWFITHNISQLWLYLIGFIYAMGDAARLALFNNPAGTYVEKVKKINESDFVGMPSPFMGGILALIIGFKGFSNGYFGYIIPIDLQLSPIVYMILALLSSYALLMPIPFPKLGAKLFAFKRYPILNWSIIILLILFCRWTLLVMSLLYLIIPIIKYMMRYLGQK